MYVIIWRFRIDPDQRAEFLRRYAADGEWARLFRRSEEYLGTELLALDGALDHFMTIDRWTAPEAWERFRTRYAPEYQALDRECEGLTVEEERIGAGVPL